MSTASPLPTYPDDEIPLTDRHWRERWAKEMTRANQLENELRDCRAARDAARQTCDDLTAHSVSQGEYIDRLGKQMDSIHASWAAEVASDIARIVAAENALADERMMTDRMAAENARLLARIESTQKRLDALIDYVVECDDRDTIAEVAAGPGGMDCPDCDGGRVETFDDIMVGGHHSTRDYTVECDRCDGTARVLR